MCGVAGTLGNCIPILWLLWTGVSFEPTEVVIDPLPSQEVTGVGRKVCAFVCVEVCACVGGKGCFYCVWGV